MSVQQAATSMPECLLYKWQPGWGLASISPACLEVEVIHGFHVFHVPQRKPVKTSEQTLLSLQAYLRFAAVDFAVENCTYTRTSPTGMPVTKSAHIYLPGPVSQHAWTP